MQDIVVVGIGSKKQVGKSTIADYLYNYHDFAIVSFADPLKEACAAIFGFSEEQLYGEEKEIEDEVVRVWREVYSSPDRKKKER